MRTRRSFPGCGRLRRAVFARSAFCYPFPQRIHALVCRPADFCGRARMVDAARIWPSGCAFVWNVDAYLRRRHREPHPARCHNVLRHEAVESIFLRSRGVGFSLHPRFVFHGDRARAPGRSLDFSQSGTRAAARLADVDRVQLCGFRRLGAGEIIEFSVPILDSRGGRWSSRGYIPVAFFARNWLHDF